MGISIGMVGVGAFAQSFIPLFRDHPRVDRVALADINRDNLSRSAKKHGIAETYDSLDEICRTDIDALVIITQPWLHTPQVIQALESGKHAYSAVPIISLPSGDEMLEWCDRLIDSVKRTGRHYMMGETSYYRPEAMVGRRRAAEGAFGHFVHAQGCYLHEVDRTGSNLREVAMRRHGKNWNMTLSGTTPMHYPTHSTGGLISVMGAHMTEVAAMGYVMPGDDWHRKDTVHANEFGNETALFRMSNGATVEIREHRRIGFVCFEAFNIYGTEASLVTLAPEGAGAQWVTKDEVTNLTVDQMRDPLPEDVERAFAKASPDNPYGGHGGSHAYMVHEFVDAVVHDRVPSVNAWEAVRYFAPGVMAHKSAMADGELLKVPDWGDAPAE
jgi:predicted dehydrogenase